MGVFRSASFCALLLLPSVTSALVLTVSAALAQDATTCRAKARAAVHGPKCAVADAPNPSDPCFVSGTGGGGRLVFLDTLTKCMATPPGKTKKEN